jgi:hypothetical protein
VTDRPQELDTVAVDALAAVLLALRVNEGDRVARESQLNALAELAAWHVLPSSVLQNLDRIPPSTIVGAQVEHFEALSRAALGSDPATTEPPAR